MTKVKEIVIYNLFDSNDVTIKFNEKYNIYIGENGVGKTTIINLVYGVLNADINNLITTSYDKIEVKFEKQTFCFSKSDILESLNLKNIFREIHFQIRNAENHEDIRNSIMSNDLFKTQQLIKEEYKKGNITYKRYFNILRILDEEVNNLKADENLNNNWVEFTKYLKKNKLRIMYFPTYRRIEEELELIESENEFGNNLYTANKESILSENINSGIKMVKAGMNDVEEILKSYEKQLFENTNNSFNRVIGDMMTYFLKDKEETNHNITFDEQDTEKINIIINRVKHEHLSEEIKKEIIEKLKSKNINIEDSHLTFFITKLLSYYKKYESMENQIIKFADVCNKYLVNKSVVYNQTEMKIYVKNKMNNTQIDLSTLSSGEKQIVSIFALTYLERDFKDIYLIIDEPELSLSVFWQESLIDDLYDSEKLQHILAVTHSPFIYSKISNEFVKNINETFSKGNNYE